VNWRRLELWVAISFGVAAVIGISLQLARVFAAEGSLLRQSAQATIDYLSELGDISGGLIVIIFVVLWGGSGVMSLLFAGIEKYHEMKERHRRLREEGRAEGRAEARAEMRSILREKGLDPEEFLPLRESEYEDSLC
jgi:hypothetical protein